MRPTAPTVGTLLLLGLAILCPSTPTAAQDHRLALAGDGTVYRLLEGTFGELFPDQAGTDPDNSVLAIDIIGAQGDIERLPVPGTEGWDTESSSSLVYEKSTGVLYMLWQTLFNGLHPLLHLVSFDGEEWSEKIEITNGPFTSKGSPKLTVTREAADLAENDRTVLHVTWWEETAGGVRKHYTPLLIQGGEYIGRTPVIDLARFQPDALAPAGDISPSDDTVLALGPSGLETTLKLRRGRDDHTVVVGFLNPDTQRLNTLEIELLHRAVGDLADKLRGHIVIVGRKVQTHDELAESAHAMVLEHGSAFHEATRRYLADQVQEAVAAAEEDLTPEGISAIADKLRGHIVIVGAFIRTGGLVSADGGEILEIGPTPDGGYVNLRVSVVSDRVAPEISGPGELFLSETGQSAIVTWEEDDRIHYRESQGDGWTEPVVIELTEDLDRDTVYRMLEERVRTD